ncbi:MAG: ergothioneine biosynthesis protein EgtB [Deltaproteobacteria bacterium]|nr:ergothioneine biosynthesis protein EgtB [Deltaproteobacteria bacterium]
MRCTHPETLNDALHRFGTVRKRTELLCRPLLTEDYVIQSMPDVSPPKWHLAHTTWFFEEFLLERFVDERYRQLFNSYYDSVGPRLERARRGVLARPSVDEIHAYRGLVDARVCEHFSEARDEHARAVLELGLQHEQQHQELLLTDLKHIFASNPLRPAYDAQCREAWRDYAAAPAKWIELAEGLHSVGYEGAAFSFDNERPRHRVALGAFRLCSQLVTAGEFLEFIEAGGYRRPELWLSDGFAAARKNEWTAPLYWERLGKDWWTMTLAGMRRVDEHAPVTHVSYYEADAYARWRGCRLPLEAEWEVASTVKPTSFMAMFDTAWQWTSSPYQPYPGFRPLGGALGEYNGKFMCNQLVLRGASWATPPSHARATYRNFFPPEARWQFSGIRLAA